MQVSNVLLVIRLVIDNKLFSRIQPVAIILGKSLIINTVQACIINSNILGFRRDNRCISMAINDRLICDKLIGLIYVLNH